MIRSCSAREPVLVVRVAERDAPPERARSLHRTGLVGMGDSDQLPDSGSGSYRFIHHREYLDAFLAALDIRDRVTLVLNDWGSALGFDCAYRHPGKIRAIAYMESFVATIASWNDWPTEAIATFQALRSELGEDMVLQDNFFIEQVLPAGVIRTLPTRS